MFICFCTLVCMCASKPVPPWFVSVMRINQPIKVYIIGANINEHPLPLVRPSLMKRWKQQTIHREKGKRCSSTTSVVCDQRVTHPGTAVRAGLTRSPSLTCFAIMRSRPGEHGAVESWSTSSSSLSALESASSAVLIWLTISSATHHYLCLISVVHGCLKCKWNSGDEICLTNSGF